MMTIIKQASKQASKQAFILRTVPYDTSGCFYDVITQVTVASFAHAFVLGFKIAGIIIIPDDTAVFCE